MRIRNKNTPCFILHHALYSLLGHCQKISQLLYHGHSCVSNIFGLLFHACSYVATCITCCQDFTILLSLSLSLSLFLFLSAAPTQYEFLDGLKYELLTFNPDDGSGLTYEAIFLSPKTTPTTATPPPLVVFPHGGPHVLYSTEFYVWSTCLAALGFAVLFGKTLTSQAKMNDQTLDKFSY